MTNQVLISTFQSNIEFIWASLGLFLRFVENYSALNDESDINLD